MKKRNEIGAKRTVPEKEKERKRAGPVSLHPLEFDEALRRLLAAKSAHRQLAKRKHG